jgi:hypothetical protein
MLRSRMAGWAIKRPGASVGTGKPRLGQDAGRALPPVRMISELRLLPRTLSSTAGADRLVCMAPPLLQERVASLISLRTSLPLFFQFAFSFKNRARKVVHECANVNRGAVTSL